MAEFSLMNDTVLSSDAGYTVRLMMWVAARATLSWSHPACRRKLPIPSWLKACWHSHSAPISRPSLFLRVAMSTVSKSRLPGLTSYRLFFSISAQNCLASCSTISSATLVGRTLPPLVSISSMRVASNFFCSTVSNSSNRPNPMMMR